MAKVEVQIRSCFCCGLSIGAVFIALYTLILYAILTGLAGWGLSDTANNGDVSYYRSCELEAQGKLAAENRKLKFTGGQTTVVVEDSTSYHCSLGLYTEELKFEQGLRYMLLVINICIFIAIVISSIILLIGISMYNQWLLAPWLLFMAIDIARGFISTFFIFFYSYWNLARIATGIFFLGMQFAHITLWIIVVAKFQHIYNRRNGIPDKAYDARNYSAAAGSTYGYGPERYPEPRDPAYYPPSHHGGPAYEPHGYRY